MQITSLVMLLLIVKVSLKKDGCVVAMNKSCSVVLKKAGLTVAITEMLESSVMVR